MNNRHILLAVVVMLIVAAIVVLERSAPRIDPGVSDLGAVAPPAPSGLGESPSPPQGDVRFPLAPEFSQVSGYINTDNISLGSLRGKVVLVDFWTYSCINCLRTLPYLKAWDAMYRDDGLVIVGVHTPEFDFEKQRANVESFVQAQGLSYPIIQDNDYGTWRAFRNNYWPRKYLIDQYGRIRYDHIGEGGYAETEAKIRELLKERDDTLALADMVKVNATAPSQVGTPEIYFGSGFNRGNFGSPEGLSPGPHLFSIPAEVEFNQAYLSGNWDVRNDYAQLLDDQGAVLLPYRAKAVNIVAGSQDSSLVYVTLDGKEAGSGADTNNGSMRVQDERLYNAITTSEPGTHVVKLQVVGKGFRLYTFTFG